jgi:hypothetical protein
MGIRLNGNWKRRSLSHFFSFKKYPDARIPNGILREFNGSAGNILGYVRNRRNFIHTMFRKSAKAATTKDLPGKRKSKFAMNLRNHFRAKVSIIRLFWHMVITVPVITGPPAPL